MRTQFFQTVVVGVLFSQVSCIDPQVPENSVEGADGSSANSADTEQTTTAQEQLVPDTVSTMKFDFEEPQWIFTRVANCDETGCEEAIFNVRAQLGGASQSGIPLAHAILTNVFNEVWIDSATIHNTYNPEIFSWVEIYSDSPQWDDLQLWPTPSHPGWGTHEAGCLGRVAFADHCVSHFRLDQLFNSKGYKVHIMHHEEVKQDLWGNVPVKRTCMFEMDTQGHVTTTKDIGGRQICYAGI